ncbi:hypothetical protein PR202_ga10611 [Eleusine coracana subsp. coracana]|uniref:Amino acid transporter transmembrane domain-containing protein n=1 Tax=Eleusine coracana subsp. coracana TaxID=191504 RepID=A0AAV5C760_ELECO|nr:hypothetical protein PR202_ga10611 [Eleusine coracana subsp. coracana]
MPYAVSQGGWLSLALFVLVGASVCYYTGTLIIERCMRAYPFRHRQLPGYRPVRVRFLWPQSHRLLHVRGAVPRRNQLSRLRGRYNLDKLFPGASFELLMGYRMQGKQLFIAIAAAVVLPTTWPTCQLAIGLVTSGVLTASLVWAGVAETTGLPTSLGLYFVCFTGHADLPNNLLLHENNKHFSKVLLISSVLCSLNYGLTAVLGYMIYGDDVQSQVTLNLPSGKLYSQVAIVMTLINPLAKYAVVAATAPFFGYLMSFIGSFLSVMATVIFPCLCFLKIYKAEGIRRTEVVAITGIMMIGVFVTVTGTYTSLQQIIRTF